MLAGEDQGASLTGACGWERGCVLNAVAVLLVSVAVAASQMTDVEVCVCSPREGAFGGVSSLGQAEGIHLVFPGEYEEADVLVDPHLYLAREDVIAFIEKGGRAIYTRPESFEEFFPVAASEEGPRGVSWVHSAVPGLSGIDWMPHGGGMRTGCVAKPGSTVIATVGPGRPFICYGGWGQGGVCVTGGGSEYFFHDEYLALLVHWFAACPIDHSLFVDCVEDDGERLAAGVRIEPALRKPGCLRVASFRLIYDPFAKKPIVLDKPNRGRPIACTEVALEAGRGAAEVEMGLERWPRGDFLIVFTLLEQGGRFLTSSVLPYTLDAPADVLVEIDRDVAIQGERLVFRARREGDTPLVGGAFRVAGPDTRAVVGPTELASDAGQVDVGKWIPGRYLLEVDGTPGPEGFVADKAVAFYVAAASYEPPYWLGQWALNLGPERGVDRAGILAYRELGFTYASWCGWGDHGPPWLDRHRETIRDRLDWAAAAGMKLCFWGHNDKSVPPRELLADFGLEESSDMHVAVGVDDDGSLRRGPGKCLTDPVTAGCLKKTYAKISEELFGHPAFSYFVIADEPGKHSRCICERCMAEYVRWMEGQGHTPEDFGVATWRDAVPLKNRANKRFFTARLTRWFEMMAESVRAVRPDVECTVNEGGGAFTFDRDRYPWWGFGPLQSLEADVYPWWDVGTVESAIRRTCFTASVLRCAGRYEKPFNLIINAQEVHCNDLKRVARPPLMMPEDLLEQYYTAFLEGAGRVEGYAGVFHRRWALGKGECYKDHAPLMALPDRAFMEWMRRPRSEMQQVVREVVSVLAMANPVLAIPPLPADVAVVAPSVEYPWAGGFGEAFKEAYGGAPLDYVGEDLDLASEYAVLLLPRGVGEVGLPEGSVTRLEAWVDGGGLLVCFQNSTEQLRHLVGGIVDSDGRRLSEVQLARRLGGGRLEGAMSALELEPETNAEIVGLYGDGAAAVLRSEYGNGVAYLVGIDMDARPSASAELLGRILSAEEVGPFACSDHPRLNLSVRKLGETHYLLALYSRGPVTWSVENPTRYPSCAEVRFSLALQGKFEITDLLAGTRLRAKKRGERLCFADDLRLARLKIYAILPCDAENLSLTAPSQCAAGETAGITVQGAPARLARLEVIDPAGGEVSRMGRWFLSNAPLTLDTCDNEKPGEWTVRLIDPQTGGTEQRGLTITPVEGASG